MSENELSEQQPNSGFKGCFPLLLPFVTVFAVIVLVLLAMWLYGRFVH